MSEVVTRPAANGADHQAVCGTDDEPTARVCFICGEAKPLNEFAKDRRRRQGRRGVCAVCRTNYDRERDYLRRACMYGHRAVVESFTNRQLIDRYGDTCFYCGIGDFECIDHRMCVRVGGQHTLDNTVPCCRECNQRKRWVVDEVLIRVYRLRFEGGMTGGLWLGPGPEHRPNRALPEWAIDKLLFGLRQDLGGGDPRKVWGEYVRIAMSAYRRGWTRNEFVDEVTKCEKKKDARGRKRWMEHRLWVQLRSYNSSDKAAFKALDKAWEAAVANLNGVGMRTKEEVHDDAVERAFLWADRITDGVDALTETEASVIGYVMSETERRGMMRVTCPSRAVGEYAKVSAMTASRTLGALTETGLLVRYSPGRPGKVGNRRAAIYGLIDPDTCQHRRNSPVPPPSPLSACQRPWATGT